MGYMVRVSFSTWVHLIFLITSFFRRCLSMISVKSAIILPQFWSKALMLHVPSTSSNRFWSFSINSEVVYLHSGQNLALV